MALLLGEAPYKQGRAMAKPMSANEKRPCEDDPTIVELEPCEKRRRKHDIQSDPEPSLASIICRCSQVQVRLPTRAPMYSLECCCVDCYQKNEWSAKQGATKPLLLSYFANKLTIIKGRDCLAFNKLREGAASTNMVTTCCSTVLCVDHPFYQGKQILMFPEFVPLSDSDADASEFKPVARVHVKDWPAEEYIKLPPLPSLWKDPRTGERVGDGPNGGKEAQDAINAGKANLPPACTPGETFQALQAAAGSAPIVLHLPELANSNRLQHNTV